MRSLLMSITSTRFQLVGVDPRLNVLPDMNEEELLFEGMVESALL